MIEQYLEAKRIGGRFVGQPGSPRTIEAYREALQRAERLLGMSLMYVTDADADRLMLAMEHLAPATKSITIIVVRNFYKWAIAAGHYKGENPFEGITAGRVNKKLPKIFSKEEIDCLFKAMPTNKYRLFFSLMYYGGLRIGEVVRIERRDVQRGGLIVRGKGNKQRYVPLPNRVYNDVRAYMREHDTESPYLFMGRTIGKIMDPSKAYVVLKEAFEVCGLEGRAHNLRHTSATHFHMATGDLAQTQKFLGHASPVTTMVYVQIADEQLRQASKAAFGD